MSEELSGEQVIQRSMAAYDALSFYSGTSAVISVSDRGNSVHAYTASAKIQFARRMGLRIEGHTTGGGRFTLVSDLERMWTLYEKHDGAAWKESELGLGGVTGVAAGAATTIPALLIRSNWGYPFNTQDPAQLEGREVLSGMACFKVVCRSDISTKAFWIDGASFLLRQMREERDEAQTSATKGRVRELLRQRGQEPAADEVESVRFRMSLDVFAIGSVNEPLDASLFQKPA